MIANLEQGDRDTEFWKAMGGKGEISEQEYVSPTSNSKSLFRVSDSTGELQVTEVSRNNEVSRSQLTSDDVFIFDSGIGVYVWVGKNSSREEKRNAMGVAMKYVVQNKLPPMTNICRVLEGGANETFFSLL